MCRSSFSHITGNTRVTCNSLLSMIHQRCNLYCQKWWAIPERGPTGGLAIPLERCSEPACSASVVLCDLTSYPACLWVWRTRREAAMYDVTWHSLTLGCHVSFGYCDTTQALQPTIWTSLRCHHAALRWASDMRPFEKSATVQNYLIMVVHLGTYS